MTHVLSDADQSTRRPLSETRLTLGMLIPGKSHSWDLKNKSRDSFESRFGLLL